MKTRKGAHFFEFLATDNPSFRQAVIRFPLATAICLFFLQWLVYGESASVSFYSSALIFLITCFIGLVSEAMKHRNFR